MRAQVLALLFALLPAAAPAEQVAFTMGSTYSRPAPGTLVLLLPPSADALEREPGTPLLLQALHAEISAAGYKTASLEQSNYETLWAQEVEAVGGIFDPVTGKLKPPQQAAALAALVRRLARETSATLVVLPKLVMRKAELHGTKAEWDGRLELIPTRGLFGGSSQHRGSTVAVSVQLIAMASSGNIAFNSFGGVTLPYTVNFVTEKPELRKELFEVQTDVAKGAKIALAPLILK